MLRVHHLSYPDVVDPQKSSFTNEIDILALAYEGLTRLDTNQETVPGAAESWEYNDDATQITFHLRAGPQVQRRLAADGGELPLRRRAHLRSGDRRRVPVHPLRDRRLRRVCRARRRRGRQRRANSPRRSTTPPRPRSACKALDDLTLQIDLTNPGALLPHHRLHLGLLPGQEGDRGRKTPTTGGRRPRTTSATDRSRSPASTKTSDWTFAANDNYWQGRPKLDGIDYVYVDDAAVALEAYRAGDLDIVQLEPTQIPEVEADPELSQAFVTYPQAADQYLAMNLTRSRSTTRRCARPSPTPSTARPTARSCAPATACRRCPGSRQGLPGAIETDKYAFDPEAAKQALAESSYGGPDNLPEIKLYFNSDYRGATASSRSGSPVRSATSSASSSPSNRLEGAALTALRKDPTTHPQLVYFGSWYQDYPDPQNWLSVFWTCDSSLNPVGYCNEEFDELTKLGDTTIDPAERLAVLRASGPDPGRRRAGGLPAQPVRHLRGQSGGHRLHPDPERGRVAGQRLLADDDHQGRGAAGSRTDRPPRLPMPPPAPPSRSRGARGRGAAAAPADPLDADGDGLEDAIEIELGTDPSDLDTDDDGATDGDEYYVHQTGTRNPDNDGDGVLDGDEVANGTDPNDPNSF